MRILTRRPDLVVINKKNKKKQKKNPEKNRKENQLRLVDFAIPADNIAKNQRKWKKETHCATDISIWL